MLRKEKKIRKLKKKIKRILLLLTFYSSIVSLCLLLHGCKMDATPSGITSSHECPVGRAGQKQNVFSSWNSVSSWGREVTFSLVSHWPEKWCRFILRPITGQMECDCHDWFRLIISLPSGAVVDQGRWREALSFPERIGVLWAWKKERRNGSWVHSEQCLLHSTMVYYQTSNTLDFILK